MLLNKVEAMLRKSIWGLAITNAVLTVLLALFLSVQRIPFSTTQPVATPQDAQAATQEIFANVTRDRLDALMVGKAVFRTFRAVEEKVVDELGRYELVGISERSGESRAFVRDTKQNRSFSVGGGESIGAFEVIGVGKDGVRLQKGADEVLLKKR